MLGMRETLRDQMVLTMAKKTLIRRAWKQTGRSTDELDQLLDGVTIPMLVQTDGLNAFQLYAELDKTRTGRAAKAGDVAPNDIVIEAGPTSFLPVRLWVNSTLLESLLRLTRARSRFRRRLLLSKRANPSALIWV